VERQGLSDVQKTDLFEQARAAPRSTEQEEINDLFVDKALDPARFYESDYRPVLQKFAIDHIDRLGPITFKHLGDLIARAHGFRRTGSEIQRQVWAAVSRLRRYSKPSASTVFWPKNATPVDICSFRGLTVNGQSRAWSEVPYPEKLGLAVDTLRRPSSDPVTSMASKIGVARLRDPTRAELQSLLAAAHHHLKKG
jgi:hypothetical protein